MLVAGTPRHANRQAERAGVRPIRFIEEAVTAQLALRRTFACIGLCDCGTFAELNACKVQVLAVSSHDQRATAQHLYAIYAVREFQLGKITLSPAHSIEARSLSLLRRAPTAASAVEQIVADKAILESVAFRFGKFLIPLGGHGLAAVREAIKRHAHQCHISGGNFG